MKATDVIAIESGFPFFYLTISDKSKIFIYFQIQQIWVQECFKMSPQSN